MQYLELHQKQRPAVTAKCHSTVAAGAARYHSRGAGFRLGRDTASSRDRTTSFGDRDALVLRDETTSFGGGLDAAFCGVWCERGRDSLPLRDRSTSFGCGWDVASCCGRPPLCSGGREAARCYGRSPLLGGGLVVSLAGGVGAAPECLRVVGFGGSWRVASGSLRDSGVLGG